MARTSAANVKGLFEHLVRALNGHMATSYNDVGGWRLDYNPVYGGYNIERIATKSGAVEQPFGSERHRAEEMWQMMRFGLNCLDMRAGKLRGYGDKRSSRGSRHSRG